VDRVAPDGPRIEAFPNTPPNAPCWGGRITIPPLPTQAERDDQTTCLVDLRVAGNTPIVFINAAYTNKGRQDDKSLGAAAAVLYYEGKEWGHAEHVFGDKVTKSDAEVGAMRPALALLSDFLLSFQYTGSVHIITGSTEAIGLFLKFGNHMTQHFSIEFAQKIDTLLTNHPDLTITIQHAKRDPTLVGFKRTRHLILEAIKCPRNNNKDLKFIQFQRVKSKAKALQAWEQQFYNTPLGNLTGNPRVGTSDTAPVTRDTAPATGTGTHRTRHPWVPLRCDGFSAV
jgi:hypothetical protein